MSYYLEFLLKQRFTTTADGIAIPFSLRGDSFMATGQAKIDTGSEYCLFQSELADELMIDVKAGLPVRLNTLSGWFTAYAHTVVLKTFGIEFESTVLFSAGSRTQRNILGRTGWLNNLHLGLTMDNEMIYLRPAYETL